MIKKGIVSCVNITSKKARVIFDDNIVSDELKIAESVKSLQTGNSVLVVYENSSLYNGVIFINLNSTSDINFTEIDGGSFV